MINYKKYIALIVTVALMYSCNLVPKKPGLWKNNAIPGGVSADLHELNDKLLKELKAKDLSSIEFLLSKDLLENNNHKRVVELIGNSMAKDNYSLFNEYYAVNQLKDLEFIKPNTDSAGITYLPVAKEMYLAFFLPKDAANKYMITALYAKFDYGWKIDKLEFEPYTSNGKTAAQLYALAQKQYTKKYLVDAVNTMASARECISPSEELNTGLDKEVGDFYSKLIMEANEKYKFPFIIEGVPTQPKIFRIVNQNINGGTYPAIYYVSAINLKDTVALKKENDNIKKVIGNSIPGIDKDKKYMLYSIYNQKPDTRHNAYSYDITVKL